MGVVDARGGFLFVKDERTGRSVLEHQIGLSKKQCEALNEPSLRRRLGRAMKFSTLLRLGHEDVPDEGATVPYMEWQRDHVVPGVDRATYRPTRDNWGPLVIPEGATVINNSGETPEDTSARIIALVKEP